MTHVRITALGIDRGTSNRASGNWLRSRGLLCGLVFLLGYGSLAPSLIAREIGLSLQYKGPPDSSVSVGLRVIRNIKVINPTLNTIWYMIAADGWNGTSGIAVGSKSTAQWQNGYYATAAHKGPIGEPKVVAVTLVPERFLYVWSQGEPKVKIPIIPGDIVLTATRYASGYELNGYGQVWMDELIVTHNVGADGVVTTDPYAPDGDHDGIPDDVDPDDDNDGVPDAQDPDHPDYVPPPEPDNDGDGDSDSVDPDDDNDGIPDNRDPHPNTPDTKDTDGDGVPDAGDDDDDGDGIPDGNDEDDDGDGQIDPDLDPPSPDFDKDGIPDYLDPDDDNDGTTDPFDRWPKDPSDGGSRGSGDGDGDGQPDIQPGDGFGVGGPNLSDADPLGGWNPSQDFQREVGKAGSAAGKVNTDTFKAKMTQIMADYNALSSKIGNWDPFLGLAAGGSDFTSQSINLGRGVVATINLPLDHPGIGWFRSCCLFVVYWAGVWKIFRILKI